MYSNCCQSISAILGIGVRVSVSVSVCVRVRIRVRVCVCVRVGIGVRITGGTEVREDRAALAAVLALLAGDRVDP